MNFFTLNYSGDYQIASYGILSSFLFEFLDYETVTPRPRQAPMPLEMTWETFPPIKLYKESKITDVLRGGSAPLGLAVNDKFRSVITQFNLPPNKFYPLNIKCRGKEYIYYWQHITMVPASQNPVNLDRTVFMKYADMDFKEVEGKYKFKSLWDASESNGRINKHAELWLEKSAYQYDLFSIRPLMADNCQYFISERLRNALIEHKITGIEMSEAPWVHAVE